MTQATDHTRLLFVDDEDGIRLTLAAVLKKQGFHVATAATVREALSQINFHKFDILLCDLNIEKPGDGFVVISAMRYAQPHCISLVLTAYPSFENAMEALQHQVDEFFTKPADIDTLIKKIREKLEVRRSKLIAPFKGLSLMLRENFAAMVTNVALAMKSDPITSAACVSEDEGGDLAKIMDALIEYVEIGKNGLKSEALKLGEAHGRRRRKQGYNARMVVREFQLVSEGIFELMASGHLPSVPLGLTTELMKLIKGLNALASEALKPYIEAPQARESSPASR